MKLEEKKIQEILLKGNYVHREDAEKAEAYAKETRGSVVEYYLHEKLLNSDLLGQAMAEHYGVPYADVNSFPPGREAVLTIPESIGRKYHVVLFKEDGKNVEVATDDPTRSVLLSALKKIFPKKQIHILFGNTEDIASVFVHYRKPLDVRFLRILKGQRAAAPEILEEIFKDALSLSASDIHFEPQEQEVLIRFRIDGLLQEVARIQKVHYENILNRIKVQARLRTDEHQAAQDGALRVAHEGVAIDIRVSIVPTIDGETVVMRLLSAHIRGWSLEDLGLLEEDKEILRAAADRPFGMILISGPTGSGKTTTLYGLLKVLNRPDVNISTIEDPVEYKIPGVNHIQVNTQTNLTFAKGLRSIVRQDPDIILVGEIRDEETAEIAVNAALTGHLLLSSFHANDAAASIPRLLNMGVEPFLLASSLNLVLAQRLVRRICDACRHSYAASREKLCRMLPGCEVYFPRTSFTLYKGKGCPSCANTGYRGRIAVFEAISVTSELQELMLHNPSAAQVAVLVRRQGARVMFQDGVAKVLSGLTTLEELMRVVALPAPNH